MIVKISGRSALILAAGLFVSLTGPSQAATDASTTSSNQESAAPLALNKYTKHSAHHGKRYAAHHKSSKAAQKSDDKKEAAANAATDNSDNSSIPPEVANANAQMASGDVPGGNAKAMSARANDIVQAPPANPAGAQASSAQASADPQVMAADQLNDVDRALHEGGSPPATALTMASAETPDTQAAAPSTPTVASSSNESSTWDQTSLIGKIFIGFGALLTMASAARMFMA